MSNVISLSKYSYAQERADAVLLMWQDSGADGWVRLVGTQDLAATVLGMLEATPAYQIGIQEVGRLPDDMAIEDFRETLSAISDDVADDDWYRVNRVTAAETVKHLTDIASNPIDPADFAPQV